MSIVTSRLRHAFRLSPRRAASGRWMLALAGCAAILAAHVACGTPDTSSQDGEIGTTSEALATTPQPFQTVSDAGAADLRAVVSVGRDYVLVTDVGSVRAFPRSQTDGKGSIVEGSPIYAKALFDIFKDQIPQINIQTNNNVTANPGVNVVQTCPFTTDVQYLDAPPAGGIPNGCVDNTYDGDTVYDEYSGHFFVMTKAHHSVWTCDTSKGPGGTGLWDGNHNDAGVPDKCSNTSAGYALSMAARQIMVAVTKCNPAGVDCENPANGWNTFTLANAYQDWAQIMVARGLVMVNYHDTSTYEGYSALGTVWGFSASEMINDTLTPNFLPSPGFTILPSEYRMKNGLADTVMLTKLHSPTSTDFPMLVTMDGSNVAAFNIVPTDANYFAALQSTPQSPALWDLTPWMGSMTLSGEATAPVPAGLSQEFNAHPVWSAASTGAGGPRSLYWSFVNGSQGVTAFRWPMTSASPSPLEATAPTYPVLSTAAPNYRQWNVATSSSNGASPNAYDFPVLEHNEMSGDTVLVFHTVSLTGGGQLPFGPLLETPNYAAAGPTDQSFAPAVTIASPTGTSTSTTQSALASAGGTIDILSNVSDPIRSQVFMTSVASSGNGGIGFTPYVTAVQLTDPPIPPVIGATQSSLTIFQGGSTGTTIPFVPLSPTANVTPATVTCSAGGDLSQPGVQAWFDVSPTGVWVQFELPLNFPLGTFLEGVSCTNGVAVVLTITVTAPVFYASPSSITMMQGSSLGVTKASTTLLFTSAGAAEQACTTSYEVMATTLPAGVVAATNSNELTLEATATATPSPPGAPYTVTVGTSGCGTTSSTVVPVTVIPYACQPETYCLNQGVTGGLQCGTTPDGCGGISNCGVCGTGETCSSNMCCPSGTTWSSKLNGCGRAGGGGGVGPICKGTTCS